MDSICSSCGKPLVVVDYYFDITMDRQIPILSCVNIYCKKFLSVEDKSTNKNKNKTNLKLSRG